MAGRDFQRSAPACPYLTNVSKGGSTSATTSAKKLLFFKELQFNFRNFRNNFRNNFRKPTSMISMAYFSTSATSAINFRNFRRNLVQVSDYF
jgi:hypothetical protein